MEYMEAVMAPLRFISDTILPVGTLMKTYQLCSGIDEKDFLYTALSIEFNAPFWTKDEILKTGLRKKGFGNFFEP